MRVFSIVICLIITSSIFSNRCFSLQINHEINFFLEGDSLSNHNFVQKILLECSQKAFTVAAKKDEFKNNLAIRIPFPKELTHVEKKLTKLGLRNQIIDLENKMNSIAELVSQNVYPSFIEIIKELDVNDILSILNKQETSFTSHLKVLSHKELYNDIIPVVKLEVNQSNVIKYWDLLMERYNMLPFVDSVELDLEDYITSKIISSLFYLIAHEEKKIMENLDKNNRSLIKEKLKERISK